MLKPHRVVIEKVGGYTEEAAAFLRRRRHSRREFVRIQHRDGTGLDLPMDDDRASVILSAARRLLDS